MENGRRQTFLDDMMMRDKEIVQFGGFIDRLSVEEVTGEMSLTTMTFSPHHVNINSIRPLTRDIQLTYLALP